MADAPLTSRCPSCGAESAAGARFCSQCGKSAGAADPPATATYQAATPPSTPKSGLAGERFAPGQVVVERFRIVTALGKGGMGEVFRADDLSLGQSVALKFLPQNLAHDADRLTRLRGEVKAARQVAHPNVCRVYDLGQADGQLFLSMEYIDGQNLASLLAQVRRLPEERGVEIARQLCLGLGAIHDRGLLHRDLKPANVMLDGRGQVRITDFGLAVPMEHLAQATAAEGTPAYQSPEQLAGREVTVRSDIYALGLILYELFTGKPAFAATSRAELAKSHAEDPPSKPSSHVSGLNPAIEKIILQCLEKEPRDRPRSAYDVLAGLPGGDPLAAALAAGQTPSPAVVADAPVEGTLHPLVALSLLLATLVGLALVLLIDPRPKLWKMVPSQLSPRDLAARAQEQIGELGYINPPRDAIYGLGDSNMINQVLQDLEPRTHRWKSLANGQPPAMFFWYCQSPEWLVPHNKHPSGPMLFTGIATADNPPQGPPGTVRICLDLRGRMIEFHAEPPLEPPTTPAPKLDWPAILEQSGLARMQSSTEFLPGWTPPQYVHERLAWQGVYADFTEIPVRAEAGLRDGRLVFFHAAPETERTRDHPLFVYASSRLGEVTAGGSLGDLIIALIEAVTWIVGAALAWHNVRLGRANVRGTVLLSVVLMVTGLITWALAAHHVPNYWSEMGLLADQFGFTLWTTAQVALGYLAIEPYVRRRWPWRVVGWNRLLAGRWRDPLIGRDVLVGGLAAIGASVMGMLGNLVGSWLERPRPPDVTYNMLFTAGPAAGISGIIHFIGLPALASFLVIFLLYLVTRREWLAATIYAVIWLLPILLGQFENRDIILAVELSVTILMLVVMLRFGLLAFTVMGLVSTILTVAPITLDMNAWFAPSGLVYVAAIVGLALYGFVIASGGHWLAWVGHLTGEAREPTELQQS